MRSCTSSSALVGGDLAGSCESLSTGSRFGSAAIRRDPPRDAEQRRLPRPSRRRCAAPARRGSARAARPSRRSPPAPRPRRRGCGRAGTARRRRAPRREVLEHGAQVVEQRVGMRARRRARPSELAVPAVVVGAHLEPERDQPLGDVRVAPAVLAEAVHEQDRAARVDAVGRRPVAQADRRAVRQPARVASYAASSAGGRSQRSEWRARRAAVTLRRACSASTASATPPTSSASRSRSPTRASRSSRSRSTRPTARRCARSAARTSCPVLVDGDEVVTDSTRILHHLEERFPDPPLFPADPAGARRGRGLPRLVQPRLEARAEPDRRRDRARRGRRARTSPAGAPGCSAGSTCSRACSTGRDHLFGAFGAADCAAWPFLRYAAQRSSPDDDELFHRVLHERHDARPSGHRDLRAWIARVGERPMA